MKLIDKAKQAAVESAVTKALEYLEKDPETNIPKLMELVDKFTPQDWYKSQRDAIRNAIQDTDSNWYKLIMNLYQLDPGVRKVFFQNFIVNASLKGSARQEEVAAQNNCNVPWAILLDPTSACNLHCTGCWAAEYGHKLNLDLETIDSIIRQGKELGVYMYIYTGGEPTVRKKDLIKLCEMHPDCEFLSFSNGTLFDEEFCDEILRVKNFVPAFSLEGSEEANDGRRGEGIYQKVMHAMKLLTRRPDILAVIFSSGCLARKWEKNWKYLMMQTATLSICTAASNTTVRNCRRNLTGLQFQGNSSLTIRAS